jgi:hypothetical protein
LSALQSLSDAQNAFMSVWLQYYSNRLETYVDLGIMRLDDRGVWIDEPLDQNLAALEEMYPLPPELPVEWLRIAGLDPNAAPVGLPTEGVPTLSDQALEQSPAELREEALELPAPEGAPMPEMEEFSPPGAEAPGGAPQAEAPGARPKRTLRSFLFGQADGAAAR